MALATRPKPPVHHRKRQAKHHRRSKVYLKPYWPYLPMLLIVGIGLAINSLWTQPANVLGARSDFSSSKLLAETNQDRAAAQQTPLILDAQLNAAAQAKAEDMAARNYWSHNAPDGRTPWTFINDSGYQYQAAGENLAYGFTDAGEAEAGWMNSPEHKANILNADYRHVGFGIARAHNFQGQGQQTIIVAEYGQPIAAVANITFSVPETAANTTIPEVNGATTELAAKSVSRIEILTQGQAAWSLVAASALAGAAFTLFITRHSLRLHRVLIRGEAYISHHPLLDIAVVFIFTTGFVLTRTTGIIR